MPEVPTHQPTTPQPPALDLALDAVIQHPDNETGPKTGPTAQETRQIRHTRPIYPHPAAVLAFLQSPLGAWAAKATQKDLLVWNPCCGVGGIARTLRGAGIKTYATDKRDYKARNIQDVAHDFLGSRGHAPRGVFGIIGFAHDGRPSARYVARSLEHLRDNTIQVAAWLLPHDFDSATRRYPMFHTARFTGKIVLTFRPNWENRKSKLPKNNWCWYVWSNAHLDSPSTIHYADRTEDSWLETAAQEHPIKEDGDHLEPLPPTKHPAQLGNAEDPPPAYEFVEDPTKGLKPPMPAPPPEPTEDGLSLIDKMIAEDAERHDR